MSETSNFETAKGGAVVSNDQLGMTEIEFIQKMLSDIDIAIERMEWIQGNLREQLADAYIKASGKRTHASDCSTSISPAYVPGPCDCAALTQS